MFYDLENPLSFMEDVTSILDDRTESGTSR